VAAGDTQKGHTYARSRGHTVAGFMGSSHPVCLLCTPCSGGFGNCLAHGVTFVLHVPRCAGPAVHLHVHLLLAVWPNRPIQALHVDCCICLFVVACLPDSCDALAAPMHKSNSSGSSGSRSRTVTRYVTRPGDRTAGYSRPARQYLRTCTTPMQTRISGVIWQRSSCCKQAAMAVQWQCSVTSSVTCCYFLDW
jgi:hypothetical protein